MVIYDGNMSEFFVVVYDQHTGINIKLKPPQGGWKD
jgi:hypothetical protein